MDPVHSRPRRIRGDRGLPQRGDLFPFFMRRQQCGGWVSPEGMRGPGFDLAQRLARRRYKNPSRRRGAPLDDDDDVKHG